MTGGKRKKSLVLLIEDDPGDQELTRRAIAQDLPDAELRIVPDGEDAIAYLENACSASRQNEYPRPDLILLDLNMPKIDGRDILQFVRSRPELRLTPVVVLTTSKHERDIVSSYEKGCNTFVSKPVTVEEFMDAIRRIGHYWLNIATAPPELAVR
ncbi:MAG: response regulator [Phycisphaerales bacterium]|nr:response regulator [Phycisphaerales bacterium]